MITEEEEKDGASPGSQVLIVDDDADIREVLAMLLEAYGYRSRCAGDGFEALGLLRRHPGFGLILLDLMMPKLDGPGFLREIKGQAQLARIPVVVLSGDRCARATAASIGADDCLTKPAELDDLIAMVRRYLKDGG